MTRLGGLARASLVLLAVASSSLGCLVTSTPTYEDPKQTPPVLIANGWANPSLEAPFPLAKDVNGNVDPQPFFAAVMSEDAGARVNFTAFLDYGDPRGFSPLTVQPSSLEPGTLGDGPRVTPSVYLRAGDFLEHPGVVCHTLTLIATHSTYSVGDVTCPVCQTDSSQLTWIVEYCDGQSQCLPEGESCATLLHHDAPWSNICRDQTPFCPFPTPMPDGGTGATP